MMISRDWSKDVGLFMVDVLWQEIKLKKQEKTSKTSKEFSESIFDKPWTKEPQGLTPI